MKLLVLVLLLSSFSSLTLMEVINSQKDWVSQSKCGPAFIKQPNRNINIIPTILKGNDYKMICQRWENKYRYATLYDIKHRIPVYSAYNFIDNDHSRPREGWKNEPQLEKIDRPEMEIISEELVDSFLNQAVNRDYSESMSNNAHNIEYTRGHVFPNQYAANVAQAESTFTFTNVAPQTRYSNGNWSVYVEEPMRKEIVRDCKTKNLVYNPVYIVTGVVPGNEWITIKRKQGKKHDTISNGVNIPSYYWTAFCCYRTIMLPNKRTISKAYLVLQNEVDGSYEFSEMSVNRLNVHLTRLYKQDFSVFGSLCLF